MLKSFNVPCLETLNELKAKCKKLGIRIVPYNYEKHYAELGIKRERELDFNQEQQAKRQKLVFDQSNQLQNGRLRNGKSMNRLSNGHFKKGIVNQNKRIQLTKLMNNTIKNQQNDKQTNEQTNKRQNSSVQTIKQQNGMIIDKFKSNGLNGSYVRYLKEDPVNIKMVLQSLENFKILEARLGFYNQLNKYELELNNQLVKYNNKPIIVRNRVDYELPPKFNYINEYKLDQLDPKTLKLIEDSVHKCSCKNSCMQINKSSTFDCCYSKCGDKCFYNCLGAIKPHILKRGPIVECTKNCDCAKNKQRCPNRVIQNGTQVRLEIFKTSDNRGWGVKTLEKIAKNKFICAYRGEVISSEEALKRQSETQFKDKYFFNLDYNEELDFKFVVDATHSANLGRFLNHSCLPNCETFIAYVEYLYLPMPVICFFSNRLIKENEELTIDYYMGAEPDGEQQQANQDANTICLCGSVHCKKYLF